MKEHRKLAAIMFTDIVGYTSLMSKDEHKALEILHKNRDIIKLLVGQFDGELLKEMGDGNLCCFGSVVDAVNCALEIQNSLRDETEFKLRIGIHVGDVVVEEGGDVFGDGVNVASRIESLAEPGGICISERVYLDIRNKPVLQVACLGEKSLKNVEYPVKVYSLTRGGEKKPEIKLADTDQLGRGQQKKKPWSWIVAVAVVIVAVTYILYGRQEEPQVPVSVVDEKPFIAVLPFDNRSSEKDQEYFSLTLMDAIRTTLNQIDDIEVLSSNTSLTLKNNINGIKASSDPLNIDYILQGYYIKSDEMIRVTYELISFSDNHVMFMIQDDYKISEVLQLQDDITYKIVNTLLDNIIESEIKEIRKRYTNNPKAYDLYSKGFYYFQNRSQEDFETALNYYEQAIEMDSTYALAYVGIADVYNLMGWHGNIPANEAFTEAKIWAQEAIDLDNNLGEAYNSLAYATLYLDWDWGKAGELFEKSIELNPYYFLAHWWHKDYLLIMGRGNEAYEYLRESIERDPLSNLLSSGLIVTLLAMGRVDEIREETQRVSKIYPENSFNYYKGLYYLCCNNYEKTIEYWLYFENTRYADQLGYAYAKSGNVDEARKIIDYIKETKPNNYMTYKLKLASLYTGLGEYNKALEILEKAYEDHVFDLPTITLWPYFDDIRSDPRFKAILRKMGLPED